MKNVILLALLIVFSSAFFVNNSHAKSEKDVTTGKTGAETTLDCNSLSSTFVGGDLQFQEITFFRSGPYFFVEGMITNGDVTPIPDNLAIRVRVMPGPNAIHDYTICMESSTFDNPVGIFGPALSRARELRIGVMNVETGSAGGVTYGNDFRIILDPDNNISETNENNNMVRCTKFATAPQNAFASPSSFALRFGQGYLDPAVSYEGGCSIIDLP